MQDNVSKKAGGLQTGSPKGDAPVRLNLQKLFSPDTLALCVVCLGINIIIPALVGVMGVPLYMDNVGSILAAALGGAVPGAIVAFVANLINSYNDPIMLYYGILTIVIAAVAAVFSRRGWLKSIRGCCVAVVCFALIGGAVGSLMSFWLFGSGIRTGMTAPCAYMLLDAGFSEFWAQFTADMIVDVPDKAFTVALVFIILRNMPRGLRGRFPLSFIYDCTDEEIAHIQANEHEYFRKYSLNAKIAFIIGASACVLSVSGLSVSILFHHNQLITEYSATTANAARMGAAFLDGNDVERYIAHGPSASGYAQDKTELEHVRESFTNVTYLYVYQITYDGCFVVFDLDTADLSGEPYGEVLPFDSSFVPYRNDLITGNSIEPIVSNDQYGWLFTAYEPVRNSAGKTVAYVGADLNMETYVHDLMVYAIQMAAILFGITLFVIALAIWYAMRTVSLPIIGIISLSRAFDKTPPETWLESPEWLNRTVVRTGDEVEQIYKAVCASQEHVSHNVKRLLESEERLRETQAIEQKNRELAEAIKLADEANAAKSAFLSRMSHDLRTPLNGIIGMAEVSEDSLDNQEQVVRNLEDIRTAGTFMLGLINDILDMSKIESGKVTLSPAPCNVREITKATGIMFQPVCNDKGVHLEIHECNDPVPVVVDKMRLQQVVFNLVSNAVKFTPKGGHVLLDASCEAKESKVDVTFVIKDDGMGMTDVFQQHMYEAFTRENDSIHNSIQGSGLGLPITKSLVTLMGGIIDCVSEPGKGTCFTVTFAFPQALEPIDGTAELTPVDYSMLSGRHMLLCEDNAVNARIVIALLERHGVSIDHAENGQIGVEMLQQSAPGFYDAVLMDIRMPVMDGLTAATNMRALDHEDATRIPIIALTANAFAEDVNASEQAGMNNHLAKPVQPDELYAALVRALAHS